MPAAERLGGIVEAAIIDRSPWRLHPVSSTFHGRDIFAPVAAHLAAGEPFGEAGEPHDPGELVGLELPRARREDDTLVTHVLTVDGFGNVSLDANHDALAEIGLRLGASVDVEIGGDIYVARYATTFADVADGGMLLYEDAYRSLALAVNRGDAAETLGLSPDSELRIRPG
jgi:S-adenosylmethionine hydrolase